MEDSRQFARCRGLAGPDMLAEADLETADPAGWDSQPRAMAGVRVKDRLGVGALAEPDDRSATALVVAAASGDTTCTQICISPSTLVSKEP